MDLHQTGFADAGPGGGGDGEPGVPQAAAGESEVPQLRRLIARQEVLLAESRHRVHNILALVRSIVSRTARADVSATTYARDLEARIAALERIQHVLADAGDARIGLGTMIAQAIAACGGEVGRQATLAGPAVSLSGRAAESLGLAVHELATNAAKHGALAAESGRIAVTWSIRREPGGGRLALEWSETGVAVARPSRRGFGSELIEKAVPYDLSGTGRLDIRETGVFCGIEIPLGEEVRAEEAP